MIGSPLLLTGGDYEISRSVRLRSSASAYFNRTPSSSGNRQIWTLSGWVKQGSALNSIFSTNSSDNLTYNYFGFDANAFRLYQWNGSAYDFHLITTAVYRDPSAWYHFVIRVDTTQATAANRVRLYINSVEVTAFSTNTTPSQNLNTYVNSTSYSHLLGRNPAGSSTYFDGYLTEINFIDGQALTPSAFGETDAITGVWKPKKYTGTYGTNGFYLNFSDNSNNTATTIGKDYSGNGNNWTPNNISVTSGATYDSMLDVPTPWADGGNGRANYAVLNPLQSRSAPSRANLEFTQPNAGHGPTVGTIGMTTGKWYWEVEVTTFNSASSSIHIGIVGDAYPFASGNYIGNTATSYGYRHNATKYNNASSSAYGASFAAGDVIGVALDLDAGTLVFYKNNASQGTAYSGLSGTFYPGISIEQAGSTSTVQSNFGQRPFAYTPPSGFKALHTGNLPEPTIRRGNQYFDAVLWTGDGTGTRTISGLGFQPDLVWVKPRSIVENHLLVDAMRGAGDGSNARILTSNNTESETWHSPAFGYLSSFNSNGFTTTAGSTSNGRYNGNGTTYVGWNWREGATQGFDIVTYTGTGANRTVAHSLGVAPQMMIVKKRTGTIGSGSSDWMVFHASVGNTAALYLNLTSGSFGSAVFWNNTSPTSSVFTVGTGTQVNENTGTFVSYLFSEVAGFSKFGSYTGNGSADGPFVFCGFRPRWVMIKRSDNTSNWIILDTARNTFNVMNSTLWSDLSSAEGTFTIIDSLSNGFKLRENTNGFNASGGTYIFAAFAENPFKYSLAR